MIIMKSSNKNKGWCEDQDKIIGELVERLGSKAWAQIAEQLHTVHNYPKRSGKQCRQRWHNHLDPNICKNSWTRIEQDILFEEHRKYGNKWTLISARLPGRTDNSIKNHFYSTVRKSLRRISKFLGSKNSTFKMRQIKPSTLSQIFSLAEQKPEQLSKDSKYNNQMKNCKEIAQYLMNFARCKLSDRRYVMDSQEKKSFLNILDQMMIINNLYENKKIVEAKMKKEKLLERNFDDAASSGSQQDSSENSQNCALRHQTAETEQKINGFELVTTRSKRKVRPPVHFQSESPKKQKQKQTNLAEKKLHQFVQYQEQPQIKEQENEHVIMKRLLSPMIQNNEEQYEEIPETYSRKNNENEQNNSDYFFIELPENTEYENKGFYQFYNSPGFKNTPHPLSPPAIHSEFLKESCQQPIKVEECDLVMNQIMEKVQKNSNLSVETLQRPVFMPSPSSAFRQCF